MKTIHWKKEKNTYIKNIQNKVKYEVDAVVAKICYIHKRIIQKHYKLIHKSKHE